MGCKTTKLREQDFYSKDYNTKRNFHLGVHLSKAPDDIEGNVQTGCISNGLRKYFNEGKKGVKVEDKNAPTIQDQQGEEEG